MSRVTPHSYLESILPQKPLQSLSKLLTRHAHGVVQNAQLRLRAGDRLLRAGIRFDQVDPHSVSAHRGLERVADFGTMDRVLPHF